MVGPIRSLLRTLGNAKSLVYLGGFYESWDDEAFDEMWEPVPVPETPRSRQEPDRGECPMYVEELVLGDGAMVGTGVCAYCGEKPH